MKKLAILGTGCAACERLAELVEHAAQESGIAFELEKIGDMDRILTYDIMATPALVVDGEVKASGRIPSLNEIREFIR